jgi:lysophospholipase L1-like esterase
MLLAAGACAGGPTTPTAIYPPIMLACPAALTLSSASGQPVAAAYGTVTTTGGAPPVSTTCSPPAGSTFPVGATTVICTAIDVLRRTQSCSFIVTIVREPRLGVTNVLAFGDSITAGETNATMLLVEPSEAYPADLQALLGQRYAVQPISVFNDGKVGETAVQGAERLPGELALHHPDLLLLLEGINDLHGSAARGGIPTALSALRTMIQHARSVGAHVIVGTLLPATPGALLPGTVALIDPFNTQLIPMALANGALVVDLYSAFVAGMPDWIGSDGLHPTVVGYQEMAQLFFNAIRTSFEVLPSLSPAASGQGIPFAQWMSRPSSRRARFPH